MADLLSFINLWDLCVIFLLEMILGFDNLLYISIESGRAPIGKQEAVRRQGIIGAVVLRVIMLGVVVALMRAFSAPFFSINYAADPNSWNFAPGWISGSFNLMVIVFIVGGAFLMYTAVKEISHMLVIDDPHEDKGSKTRSTLRVVAAILLMNLVFSFDSTLTALAISDLFVIQAAGIILSGIVMYLIADQFAAFLARNRMYEVLGLFVLLIVGISLLGEGGHVGHLAIFGHNIEPLAKSTFYFSIAVLFLVEIIQTRYQRKLEALRKSR